MDFSLLKARAKNALQSSYWTVLVACLILGIFEGSSTGGSSSSSGSYLQQSGAFERMNGAEALIVIGIVTIVVVIAITIAFALNIFIGNALRIGFRRFMDSNSKGFTNISLVFSGFKTNYLNGVKTLLIRDLLCFLWSLLFVIPGIIKGYSYMLVEHLLALNPDMDSHEALETSERLMQGHKWEAFCLQLSFIGWYLLGFLACCIGTVFVRPYYEATMTEYYNALINGGYQA